MESGHGDLENEFQARKLAFNYSNRNAYSAMNNETYHARDDWRRCEYCAEGQREYRTVMYRCRTHNLETPGWDGVMGVWQNQGQNHAEIQDESQGRSNEKTAKCAWNGPKPSISTAVDSRPLDNAAAEAMTSKTTWPIPKTWSNSNDDVIPKEAVVDTTSSGLNQYQYGMGPSTYRPISYGVRIAPYEAYKEEAMRERKRQKNFKRSEQRKKYQEKWEKCEETAVYSKLGIKIVTAPKPMLSKESYLEHYNLMIPIRDVHTQTPKSKWEDEVADTTLPTSKYESCPMVRLLPDRVLVKQTTLSGLMVDALTDAGFTPPDGGFKDMATRLSDSIYQKLMVLKEHNTSVKGLHPDYLWDTGSQVEGVNPDDQWNMGSRVQGVKPDEPENLCSIDQVVNPDDQLNKVSRVQGVNPDQWNTGSQVRGMNPDDQWNKGSRVVNSDDQWNKGSHVQGVNPDDQWNKGSQVQGVNPDDQWNKGSQVQQVFPNDQWNKGSRVHGVNPDDQWDTGSRFQGVNPHDQWNMGPMVDGGEKLMMWRTRPS